MKRVILVLSLLCGIDGIAQDLSERETLDYLSNLRNQQWLKSATYVHHWDYKISYQTLIEEKHMKNGDLFSERHDLNNSTIKIQYKKFDPNNEFDAKYIVETGISELYKIIIQNNNGTNEITSFENKSDAEKFKNALEYLIKITQSKIDPFGTN